MMSNLRRRLISWHAGCIDYWYQPNKYYERPIRIHLRSLSTLRRKRPWRPRDFSIRGLCSRCHLINLAVRAGSCENLCASSCARRSLPHDYNTASCRELIQLDGDHRELRESGVARSRSSKYSLRFFQGRCGWREIGLLIAISQTKARALGCSQRRNTFS